MPTVLIGTDGWGMFVHTRSVRLLHRPGGTLTRRSTPALDVSHRVAGSAVIPAICRVTVSRLPRWVVRLRRRSAPWPG